MKKKIIGIFVVTLLIATSASASLGSNLNLEEASSEIDENKIFDEEQIDEGESVDDILSNLQDDFTICMSLCLGGIALVGDCLYMIIGCAAAPGPWNPCCWAAPVLCGIDIGILLVCISKCLGAKTPGEDLGFPPILLKLIQRMQDNNNTSPLLILGLLCLLRKLDEITEWLREHGYTNIETSLPSSLPASVPSTFDCGCD